MYVVSVVVDVDDFEVTRLARGEAWARRALDQVEQMLREVAPRYSATTAPMPPDAWVVTLHARTAGEVGEDDASDCTARLERQARAFAVEVQEEVGALDPRLGVSVTIGVGGVHALSRMETAVREASRAMDIKLLRGGNEVYLHGVEPPAPESEPMLPPERVEDQLTKCIRRGDVEAAVETLHGWVERISRVEGVTPDLLRRWIAAALLHALDVAGRRRLSDGSTDWVAACSLLSPDEVLGMFGIHERSYLRLWLEQLMPRIVDVEASQTPGRQVLRLVEHYISDHYAEDLRLVTVARAVSVSPYYISHLFQRERGTTFLKYLTGVRMHHGRRYLAETDLPVETIAERVGYSTPKRFRVLFKRTFHVTPSEYRRIGRSGTTDGQPAMAVAG